MAGVGSTPGISAQAALVAELRWRMFRNSLGSWKARLDLLALIVVGAIAGFAALSIGVALGFGAYSFVEKGRPELLGISMWAVFAGWQLIPLMMVASTVEFDFRNLLSFPLRFPAFFLLSLIYGLFDPAGITALVWLACIATGILLARPEMWAWIVVVLGIYAGTNLMLNRLLLSWLERVLERRRTREVFVVVLLLGMVALPLAVALGERWGDRAEPFLRRLVPPGQVLPPGLAGKALAGAARGNAAEAAASSVLLAAYGACFGLLLRRRLRAQYRGENLGEAQAPAATLAESRAFTTGRSGWPAVADRVLPGPVAAVFEKELRYVFRNGATILNLVLPLIMVVFFAVAWSNPNQRPAVFALATQFFFPLGVAYSFLILAPLAHNTFAFENRGMQLLLAAPVRFREILLGKNLAHSTMIVLEACAIWLVLALLVGPPGAMVAAATFSALAFAALVHFTAGNILSLYFPRRFEDKLSQQRAAGVTVLIGLALQIAVLGPAAGIFFLADWFGQLWVAVPVFLGLSVVALRIYVWILERCTRIAAERREVLTAELCR